ncbi:hypothetical protein FX983_04779 [Pseudomonas frederiksbergensis]|jgi:hypothetical protein|uniref:Uncharacterized protein n=1 Tax=Pseudomonas frederiksbergensis TaxID=104087 RepID=A0A6L5BPS0_9PSED|nr:hypothetical protein PMI27_005183 [Pseudomonas sp. GM41(2012)]KAF2390318.1 hypothetical protein FX983_04779 [Pseudomonas frederiksbergensis]
MLGVKPQAAPFDGVRSALKRCPEHQPLPRSGFCIF